MLYLIDGYNLLYALGILRGRVGPQGLERARLRLLGMLRGAHGQDASSVTVVFDAAGGRGGSEEQEHEGIHVRFAVRQEADDVIEFLIRRDSSPRRLTVVSDDHRLQQAARRRQCVAMGCLDYLDELARLRLARQPRPGPAAEKTEALSPDGVQEWLREFSDLEDDPAFREISAPYEFLEAEEIEEGGEGPGKESP